MNLATQQKMLFVYFFIHYRVIRDHPAFGKSTLLVLLSFLSGDDSYAIPGTASRRISAQKA
jgi:hypothetical protein